MKITVTLKDPNGFYECITEAIDDSLPQGLTPREEKALKEARRDEIEERMRKWVESGEYVDIVFDLEAMTATVVART